MAQQIALGVDIGTSHTKLVAGYVDSSDTLNVIAHVSGPSEGVKKGSIANLEAASECVSVVLDEFKRQCEVRPDICLSSIDGTSIKSTNGSGSVAIEGSGLVSETDVRRAIDASAALTLKSSDAVLHLIPRAFTLDDYSGIESPLGMIGSRLSVDTHIMIVSQAAASSRVRAFDRARLRVAGLVAHGIASAEGVLGNDERDLGVCLVDIGAGTTNLVVYKGSGIVHSSTIALGGANITNDLAIGLGIHFSAAEKLKITLSDLSRFDNADQEMFADIDLARSLSDADLSHVGDIVKARLSEIFELIVSDLRDAGVHRHIPAGLVITGGTANIVGLAQFASEVTGYRCTCATPRRVLRSVNVSAKPEYSSAAGLVRIAFSDKALSTVREIDTTQPRGLARRARSVVRRLLS
ncbi:MAG: cell division protein FtsA [Bacillota bacterium]|nr:cell division protein FtsA [Bacillota bacterium]HQD18298.1 cell division protein FtsA [Bacillota bacterium]